ncbi:hypothetical protein CgunFtcFv8_020763 [Champsocephalus gunnari]|uniref:Dipeptidase n=1 Tax=Champsocephalus gunnari TaxID=52237 RepID=A0AAN8E570_CHAGU|nr:hypothetical protein CgunFtcFv8_020763 [Champsocephalus gunnari]
MLSKVISAAYVMLWISSCAAAEDPYMTRALQLMSETPLIDGHNDLPWQLRMRFNNELNKVDLNTLDTTHTNIPKIKEGRLGAQFWSAYVPCESQYKDAVRQTLEQIDVVHRMCQKYPETFMFATSSHDIMTAFSMNKTASLIGVEGGSLPGQQSGNPTPHVPAGGPLPHTHTLLQHTLVRASNTQNIYSS